MDRRDGNHPVHELGLHSPDGVIADLRAGRPSIGGATPVNTGGGLLSRGHPIGATGTAQNGGGVFSGDEAVVVVTVLERSVR